MAAAAETLGQRTREFDWELAEEQFLEAGYICAPESEIYGRSLSTVRRFGAFMINKTLLEVIDSPEAAQPKAEFFTSVEEGFGTDTELGGGLEVRDFDRRPIINGRVMAKDNKTPVSTMTAAGLKCAEEKFKKEAAKGDRRFFPQLTRSTWDHKNALNVDKMARGETDYNTIIVVTPFVEEAAAQSGGAYWRKIGYVPRWKRGFVQLYHAAGGNEVISGSLSFDGSNKQRLREIFRKFGKEIPAEEITDNWLKYAITGNFSEEEARGIATAIANEAEDPSYEKNTNTVDVTKEHELIMERAFNESYVHICESLARGCQTDGVRALIYQLADKARDFNERYASALYRMRISGDQFTDDDSVVLHELLVYSTIEMMRALHLEKALQHGTASDYGNACLDPIYLQSADPALFQNMLSGFGATGARNNRVYSACGLEISLGDDGADGNPQSAYGGVDSGKERVAHNGKIRCIKCREYVRKAEVVKRNCWECPRCKHKVDICTGAVLREGESSRSKHVTRKIGATMVGFKKKKPESNSERR
jgi:hypothetical protein